MGTFFYDGIAFNYKDDETKGHPFLFLHGLGGDVNQTFGVMKPTPGIRRISIDFRGHGKTVDFGTREKFSFSTFANDARELIDYLNLDEYSIGGISTGAGVALRVALDSPKNIKRLVLSRPAWLDKPQEDDIQKSFKAIHEILQDDLIKDKKEKYIETPIYKKMNSIAKYAGETLLGQFNYKFAKETSEKLVRIPSDCPNDNKEDWRKIEIPTLILRSRLDPIHPYQYGKILYDYISDSKLIEITPKEISGKKHKDESYERIKNFLVN